MIHSFKDKESRDLFDTGKSRRFSSISRVAIRKLTQLDLAPTLEDLKVPPGNQLEALVRDRRGQHSIRVNDQFRICFIWRADGAHDVEIVDYH